MFAQSDVEAVEAYDVALLGRAAKGSSRGLAPRSLVGQVNFIAIVPLPEMTFLADTARIKKSTHDVTAFCRHSHMCD